MDGIVLLTATAASLALAWPAHALAHWLRFWIRHRYGG